MAIDYGDVRTGIAVSDLTLSITGDAFVIREKDPEKLAERLCIEAEQRDVEKYILGLPRNMDGSESFRAEKSRTFKAILEGKSGLPVILWDERRSSIEAHAILHASGKKEREHKKSVDAVAASLLLESYLDSIKL
jgi:putative Holliday junction resolvase